MNEINFASALVDGRYYDSVRVKYCPDIFTEISDYNPKDPPFEPIELTQFKQQSKNYQLEHSYKFYSQAFIGRYLGDKWQTELYNRNNFFRLYDILSLPLLTADEKQAVLFKLSQFKRKIQSNSNHYKALIIDFSKFPFDTLF